MKSASRCLNGEFVPFLEFPPELRHVLCPRGVGYRRRLRTYTLMAAAVETANAPQQSDQPTLTLPHQGHQQGEAQRVLVVGGVVVVVVGSGPTLTLDSPSTACSALFESSRIPEKE